MNWIICLVIAALIIAASIAAAVRMRRHTRRGNKLFLSTFQIIFAGVFCAVFVSMLPVYAQMYQEGSGRGLKTVMSSLHTTFQVFTIDVDSEEIIESVSAQGPMLRSLYTVYLSVIFVCAPLLTFGFIFSFVRNLSASLQYLKVYFRDLYVFSELNEKSIALAEDLKKNHPEAGIVFADVSAEEQEGEYIENARKLNGICFRKSISGISLYTHSRKKKITLFLIGEDQTNNINLGLKLIETYQQLDNMTMYVFSTRVEGEILLTQANRGKMRIHRVDEVRSLIYNMMYENGCSLFENAKPEGDSKKITAVIIGMGQHGTEMLKALAWYCQMDGYTLQIHAFEKDPLAEDRLTADCPELMSDTYNGKMIPGEAQYTIRVHSGMDVTTHTFVQAVKEITDVTYVLVSLGTDEMNIRTAVDLRKVFERMHVKPAIQAIVYNPDERKALEGITNYRGQPYQVDFIGDLQTMYSEKVILSSELERQALKIHLRWGKEDEFWQYEYNYRSSVASAIQQKAREYCGIPGATKREEDLTGEERRRIESVEHRRWNAYMRSEGYIYSGSKEKSSRNDLGKMHHDLVDYDSLSDEEKRKDSRAALGQNG